MATKPLWSLNARLERLFDDPNAFRAEQCRCDVLISGMLALQFFELVTWLESDLDMYAQIGQRTKSMHNYLINTAGYVPEYGSGPTADTDADDPYTEYQSMNPHGDIVEACYGLHDATFHHCLC